MHLKIDPEIKNLIPPLLFDEMEQLEQNILAHGKCRNAIKVWRGYIIDGHNRYSICQKHGIHFDVEKIRFASRDEALLWVADNQLGQRNLSKAMRIELACTRAKMLGDANRKSIAQAAGVSEQTVHRYMKIVGMGSDDLVAQVKSGKMKINTGYKQLNISSRSMEVFFDETDPRFNNTPLGYRNVLCHVEEISRVYRALDKACLFLNVDDDLVEIAGRLKRHVDYFG